MVRRSVVLAVLVCSLASLAFARGNLKELTVPLKYSTQEGVHSTSPDIAPSILRISVDLRVEDARKLEDPLLIGHGTGGDDKKFPIHADRDVVSFVRESVTGTAKDWGLKLESPGERILVLQLTRFDLDESNKALGSIYATEVKLAWVLKDGRGNVLGEGSGTGTARRYGHAHSPENCNEVLSDALKEAFGNVVADADLQKAWADGKRSGNTSHTAASSQPAKESTEERLKKLDDLLKKKVITQEEYAKKRAEILKEM
jgi:hypothetical protein